MRLQFLRCCSTESLTLLQALTKRSLITATAASSLIGCFLMGIGGNLPIALAPGMGLNAYFTYNVVGYRGEGSVGGCHSRHFMFGTLLFPSCHRLHVARVALSSAAWRSHGSSHGMRCLHMTLVVLCQLMQVTSCQDLLVQLSGHYNHRTVQQLSPFGVVLWAFIIELLAFSKDWTPQADGHWMTAG